ncbi:glycoside hydrolase superfamily [Aspergillus unguis]
MVSFRWSISVLTSILAFSAMSHAVPFHRDHSWHNQNHGHNLITRPNTSAVPTPSTVPSTIPSSTSSTSSGASTPSSTPSTNIWHPTTGTTWQIILAHALTDTDITTDKQIYDIDLFDNPASTISTLHSNNQKAICYFSAGTYEDWRPDASAFTDSDKGSALDDWEGENWLDVRSENVRSIMAARLDTAAEKGCDGVDPDNVDAYGNEGGGLDLTQDDAVEYIGWLASEARARGLAIGLKNAGDIIPRVLGDVQWGVNEQCVEYGECEVYQDFVSAGKPVFHIEYPGGEDDGAVSVSAARKASVCNGQSVEGFSTVMKKMDLDDWVQTC